MNKNHTNIFILSFILILIPIGLWLRSINENQKKNIELNGIEGIGCVENKSYTKGRSITYSLTFDFIYEDKMITAVNSIITTREDFNNAIIGMKYKIKFLPDSPHKNAIIYIDKPIQNEYQNITKERERIMNTYKINRKKIERFDK